MKRTDRHLRGMPARGFLMEDPAGSQGQTGNNGFFPPLLLFGEEGARLEQKRLKGGWDFAALCCMRQTDVVYMSVIQDANQD